MAGVMGVPARGQYAAMAQMRWRMLANSLRTRRGKFELGAGLFSYGFSLLVYLSVGIGLALGAWHLASANHLRLLWMLLWPVLLMWQVLPVMLTSYQENNVDLSILLRFPVSFASYALLYILFGLFDGSSLLGGVALLGIWIGMVAARPDLALWAALALTLFAAFNILLTRMIFAWLDRWLAQRKTREIVGTLFLFLFLGLQALNPAFHHNGRHHALAHRQAAYRVGRLERFQRPFPPALAGRAIQLAGEGHGLQTVLPLAWLTLYAVGAAALLGVRLRAEYRGESLGEGPGRVGVERLNASRAMTSPAVLPSLHGSSPLGAIFEKELRYLSRSGTMLYGLLAPLVLLFLFGGLSGIRHASVSQYALPLGVVYGFLGTMRLVANSLGGEATGIQLYFLAPTRFKTVMLAKNLLQLAIFGLELVLVGVIVFFRFGMPGPQIIAVTFCWLLFALPVQLAVGNVLSITMPYRMALTRISRGQGGTGNALLILLTELVLFAIGAAIFLPLNHAGHARLAAAVFLFLAAGGILAWLWVFSAVDGMATNRREVLIATLVRST